MRVISGKSKGRRLRTIPGDSTRPTADRVKESIFNLLGPTLQGVQVLDLFAGSGALGIEAISRGAKTVVFIDNNFRAIQVIKENIESCGFQSEATIHHLNAKQALNQLKEEGQLFDLVFLDPPYNNQQYEEIILTILKNNLLTEKARVVVEYDYKLSLPSEIGMLSLIKNNKYGDIKIAIYQAKGKGG